MHTLLLLSCNAASQAHDLKADPSSAISVVGRPAEAFEDPMPVAIQAIPSVVSDSGHFHLRLACLPEAKIQKNYALRVALSRDEGDLVVFDHELDPPTSKWRAGQQVDYVVPFQLPQEQDLGEDSSVGIRIGFATAGGASVRALGGPWIDYEEDDGLTEITSVIVPAFSGTAGSARMKTAFDEADELRRAGAAAGAWKRLHGALRATQAAGTEA